MDRILAMGGKEDFVEKWYLHKGAEAECEKYKQYKARAKTS